MKRSETARTHDAKASFVTPRTIGGIPGVLALQSTRLGGVSRTPWSSLNLGGHTGDDPAAVEENFRRLACAAGIKRERIATARQVHGTRVAHVCKPGVSEACDALITDTPHLHLCIVTADCFPVVLLDTQRPAIAAIHAGWKGAAGGIVGETLAAMTASFGTSPEKCRAWIGAGISGEHYEVGEEVAAALPEESRPAAGREGKFLLDIAAALSRQLRQAGLEATSIEISPFCSFRDAELFFSYRRDRGATGRMATLAGLTPPL